MLTNSSWSNLLQGVAQATSQLLTTTDYGLGIHLALATLGQVTNVDRVYIAQIHPHPELGEPATSLRYEWSRDTIEPQIDNPRVQNVPFSAFGMERWYDEIQRGEPLSLLVQDYPPDSGERQRFEPQGILSIIVVPIPVNGEFWGVVGFDDCQTQRRWSKDEEAVLMTMAATLGGAIAHRQTEIALRQSQSRIAQIAANVPGMIFQFLQRSDRSRSILYASSGCIELYELEPEAVESNFQMITDLIHPEDREAYELSVAASITTQQPWNWEGRIITYSGKLKWLQGRSRPQPQPNGDILWDGFMLDITDRKQAEIALQQSEARNRAFVNAIPDLMFRLHRDGTYLDVKAENVSDLLIDPTYAIGKSVYELLPDGVAKERMYYVEQALKTGEVQSFEYQLAFKEKQRDYEARIVVSGEDEVLTIVRDITQRRQAEIALRESEEQYRSIFEATSDALLINCLDGTLIEANPAAYKMHGYSYKEFINLDPRQYIHPDFHLKLKDFFEMIQSGGEYRIQSVNVRKDGSTFPVDVLGIGFTYKGELHSLAIVRDITERIKAEVELHLSAQRDRLRAEIASRIRQSLNIEQILKTTVTEVRQFLNADRVFIIQINESQNTMFAESVTSGCGSIRELFFEDFEGNDTLRQLIPMFIAEGVLVFNDTSMAEISPLRAEYFAKYGIKASLAVPIEVSGRVSGRLATHQCRSSRQWEQWEIDFLEQLATQVAIALQQAQLYQEVQDLNTNLEQLVEKRTQELQQKYAELQELHQLKDVFLHAVSHDLRTPVMGWLLVLNNLLNQSSVAIVNEQRTLSVSRSILERMIQSSDRQLRLIDSLLDIHQSEVQGMVLQREPIQLRTLTQNLVEDLAALLEKNKATITNHITTNLPVILADSTQLQRVFENLLSNAMNHNPPGVHLTLEASVEPNLIRCSVSDNGIGMNQETTAMIFQLYTQGNTQKQRPKRGLGLGLYLCHQIITAHGGDIGVDSCPNIGTTFWFTLPRQSNA